MKRIINLIFCLWLLIPSQSYAANTKISELNAINNATLASGDKIPVVDVSGTPETKSILISELDARWQALDSDLTTLAGLTATTGNMILSADSAWTSATPSTVRTALSLVVGTNVQAYDAQLADVAGLTPTDNAVVIGNGSNFVVESGATLKTSLGLTIGTDVQAYDSDLAAIAGLTYSDGNIMVGNGTTAVMESGATLRTSIGLGTGDDVAFDEIAAAKRVRSGDTETISASAIDWAEANVFIKTLSGNTTFTFSNVPTNGGQTITVCLTQDSTPRTVTWPTVRWANGVAPTMGTGSGEVDCYTFVAISSTVIMGTYVQSMDTP